MPPRGQVKHPVDRMRERPQLPEPGRRDGPLWRGPEEDGVTFSLLSRFLVCRERFRLLVVDGWRPADHFSHRVEYGNMWHACEEAFGKSGNATTGHVSGMPDWYRALHDYSQRLAGRYPTAVDQVRHWSRVCKMQFGLYVDHWRDHPDEVSRRPLLQERVFAVKYRLPSGRYVLLRGKWDGLDVLGEGRDSALWLREHKTKGDVDVQRIQRQLTFDLQTMLYLVAMDQEVLSGNVDGVGGARLAGVLYNVVRRPLSGGKGTIRQNKNESEEEFYLRLAQYIKDEPDHYFARWRTEVSRADRMAFRQTCLDPILEQLCVWWDFVSREVVGTCSWSLHWRHPFGVYNVLDEGGSADLDEMLATRSTVGLERAGTLFPELE